MSIIWNINFFYKFLICKLMKGNDLFIRLKIDYFYCSRKDYFFNSKWGKLE